MGVNAFGRMPVDHVSSRQDKSISHVNAELVAAPATTGVAFQTRAYSHFTLNLAGFGKLNR